MPSATSRGIGRPRRPGRGRHAPPDARPPGAPLPAPVTVRVNVYNATSRQGLAGLARRVTCAAQGFAVAMVGNDPRHRTVKGRGEIRYGARRRAGRADGTDASMAGARLVRDHRRDATIDLVAGERFTHLRPPRTPSVASGAAGAGGRLGLLSPAAGCRAAPPGAEPRRGPRRRRRPSGVRACLTGASHAWSGGATTTEGRPGSCSKA